MLSKQEYKILAWFRWISGVACAVIIALFLFNVTFREKQVDGCIDRRTNDYYQVQYLYAEQAKSELIAAEPLVSKGTREAAKISAKQAQVAANRLAKGTANNPDAIKIICENRYPATFPNNLIK